MRFPPLSAQRNMCWLTGALHVPLSCRYVDTSPLIRDFCDGIGHLQTFWTHLWQMWHEVPGRGHFGSASVAGGDSTLPLWHILGRKSDERSHFSWIIYVCVCVGVCLLLLIIQLLSGLSMASCVTGRRDSQVTLITKTISLDLVMIGSWKKKIKQHPKSLSVLGDMTKIAQIFSFTIKHYERVVFIIYL